MSICRRLKRGEKANWSPFCDCGANIGRYSVLKCSCGEEDEGWVEWAWDPGYPGSAVTNPHGTAFIGRGFGRPPSLGSPILLMSENRQVMFHPSYSSGTAAVRGQHPLEPGMHHYWEVKILTYLYGTDMMVGVGTAAVDLCKNIFKYCSLLGEDNESWGYSYNGNVQHGGEKTDNGYPFGLGSIIGVHVDLWHGKLEFYLNRKPLGVAFSNLHGKTLYPMVSSTAAKSGIRLIHASSHPHSLLLSCTRALGIASEASLYGQPHKRPCLDGSSADSVWGSSVTKGTKNAVSALGCLSRGGTSAEVVSSKSPSKAYDGHSCVAKPVSPISSARATLCNSNKLGDASIARGLIYSKNCDKITSSQSVGSGSNSESTHLIGKTFESSDPVVEASNSVMPVRKLHQSAYWLRKASSNTERCQTKEPHVHFEMGANTSHVSSPKSKDNISSLEMKSKDPISDPYLFAWLKEEEVETTPKLDIVMCPHKRKRPPCDFVECIWSIPGLRAKVECSFWWLLGTRRGNGVLVASGDATPAYPSLIIVDEDEAWARRGHGEIIKSGQDERIHHQAPEDSVNRQCHERLCLMCHTVI